MFRAARDDAAVSTDARARWQDRASDERFESGRRHRVAVAKDSPSHLRSTDPIGFWIVIAFKAAIAIWAVVGTLGELLRFWKL